VYGEAAMCVERLAHDTETDSMRHDQHHEIYRMEREWDNALREEDAMLWTQRNGEQIDVRDMTDSHLINSGRMVYRRYRSLAVEVTEVYAFSPPTGDMASYDYECAEIVTWEQIRACEFWLLAFAEEVNIRQLSPEWQLPTRKTVSALPGLEVTA
jgi:hypothetical protein